MATTISPSLGHAPLFTQGGVGSTPGYDAIDVRLAAVMGLQEGAYEANAYKVSERGAGANLSVDIDADAGFCLVQGDSVAGQGLYVVPPHTADINEAISAAHATLPRLDQVVLEVQDNTHDSSGNNRARVRVVDGTPTSGATLDNRNGAAALPANCLRLADVLVPATDTTISNSQIRDRRPWARGAYYRIVRNANAAAGNNYSTTSATAAAIDSTNLAPRIECSGAPLRVRLSGQFTNSTTAESRLGIRLDGAVVDGGDPFGFYQFTAAQYAAFHGATWDISPSAGSHTVAPYWRTSGGTLTGYASSTVPMLFTVEEIVRQNASNG